MRSLLLTAAAAVTAAAIAAAQVHISTTERAAPTSLVFMDMAMTAAQSSAQAGGKPCGAVVILNGAWRATGRPDGEATAEEDAFSRSRLSSLRHATVYTLCEPTTASFLAMCRVGADSVVFAVPREEVIAAGLYGPEAWQDTLLDGKSLIPLVHLEGFPGAAETVRLKPQKK